MNLATTFQDAKSEVQKKIISAGIALSIAFGCAMSAQNANAEPAAQAVNHSSPITTQQAQPDDDFMDAANYAKEHNTVTIWICAPLDSGKTPEQLAEIAEKGFQRMGIPEAKGFSAVSLSVGNRVAIFVGDELYRNPDTGSADFYLHNIREQLNNIRAAYDAKNSTAYPAGRGLKPRP